MFLPPKAATDILKQFGTTIDGHPRWRVIWSDLKLSIADGKECREYEHLAHRWILEKWCANECSPEQWEYYRVQLLNGPEPYILWPYSSGSYEMAYAFSEGMDLELALVELIPKLIKAGLERATVAQRKIAIQERLDKAKRGWDSRNSDIYDDAQDAFKGLVYSGAHGHSTRSISDINFEMSTADVPAQLRKPGFRQM